MYVLPLVMTSLGVFSTAQMIEKGITLAAGIKNNHPKKWIIQVAACMGAFLYAKGFLLSAAPYFLTAFP